MLSNQTKQITTAKLSIQLKTYLRKEKKIAFTEKNAKKFFSHNLFKKQKNENINSDNFPQKNDN